MEGDREGQRKQRNWNLSSMYSTAEPRIERVG